MKYSNHNYNADYYDEYIKCKVVSMEESDDLSYHGSSHYVMNYTVLGEDGRKYWGNYLCRTLGNYFFLTRKDYIECLKHIIDSNLEQIEEIKKDNEKAQNLIRKVKPI